MSSSPGLEQSSPSATTPSSPALRVVTDQYVYSSTPNSLGKSNKPLQVVLPGTPTTPPIQGGDLTLTPPPRSPGGDGARVHPPDGNSSDKFEQSSEAGGCGAGGGAGAGSLSGSALSRKESYKAQRQNYRKEKKRATSALLHSIEEPGVVVLADWLKVRGSLKSWTKLWCVLKPGLLLLYKSSKAKSSHWVGTVILTSCQVIERPSKKDGFCFKLYHPLEQSIWAPRGPHNETIGAVVQPLPSAHLIFRAPSQAAGHCWLDGLELALKCSNAMLRCSRPRGGGGGGAAAVDTADGGGGAHVTHEDLEKHFNEHELEGSGLTDSESDMSAGGAEVTNDSGRRVSNALELLNEVYQKDGVDDVGPSGEIVEEIAEENKSLIWFLLKQVRPGMDLSKVVLPTFILEPRSFLDKLSDNYYHADILASACKEDDAYQRFKLVLRWYLSGLYKKPRGLKKPYNPVLGEMFRCYWHHPDSNTRTHYIAEQVSHHPPVSAFYISNRKEGFVIEGSLLAKSKFYGNSTSALLEGSAQVVLVNRDRETYLTSAPYAHCKGIVIGTLSMELGGKVHICCNSTGYSAEIDFKLRGFLGGSDQTNVVSGRIKKGKETIANIDGYWDARIDIKDKRTGEDSVLVDCAKIRHQRLKRYLVKAEKLHEFESQRLWIEVSRAIAAEDQVAATEEKTKIEEAQREKARSLVGEWTPRHFHKEAEPSQVEGLTDQGWRYNHSNFEPWSAADLMEYEEDFVMQLVRGRTAAAPVALLPQTSSAAPSALRSRSLQLPTPLAVSDTDSQHDNVARQPYSRNLKKTLTAIDTSLREQANAVERLRDAVESLGQDHRPLYRPRESTRSHLWDLFAGFVLAIVFQSVVNWIFFQKE